jgi:hypothetical protein
VLEDARRVGGSARWIEAGARDEDEGGEALLPQSSRARGLSLLDDGREAPGRPRALSLRSKREAVRAQRLSPRARARERGGYLQRTVAAAMAEQNPWRRD